MYVWRFRSVCFAAKSVQGHPTGIVILFEFGRLNLEACPRYITLKESSTQLRDQRGHRCHERGSLGTVTMPRQSKCFRTSLVSPVSAPALSPASLTLSPPILLCQFPVFCRAIGVDLAGGGPGLDEESQKHTHTHEAKAHCFVYERVTEAQGKSVFVFIPNFATARPQPPPPPPPQYLRPLQGVSVTGLPPAPAHPCTSLAPSPPHPSPPLRPREHGSRHVPRLPCHSRRVSLAQTKANSPLSTQRDNL